MSTLTIVIPTYNEAANLETLLSRLGEVAAVNPGTGITVAIVDDSSPDGTADLARSLAPKVATANYDVRVLSRAEKQGLGAAYIWAFDLLLGEENPPTYIVQMDADLSHDPKYISDFIRAADGGADFVCASRYIKGGGTPDWTLDRKILSRGGNLYTRILLGSRLTDYTGGFNLYTPALLERVRFRTIASTGYGFQIVLKYRAAVAATKAVEVPIIFLDRTEGTSKIPSNTLMKNLRLVAEMRFLGKHR